MLTVPACPGCKLLADTGAAPTEHLDADVVHVSRNLARRDLLADELRSVDADTYLVSSEKLEVKVQKDNPIEITLKKKPKNASVALKEKELVIRQQIQFGVDSANILATSNLLLSEIADILLRNPRVKKIEVQGHTDGTGNPAHNMKLSEDRASAVVTWLVQHGIHSDRLVAKGYGDSRPIVPNVTELNRARNRRVQFIRTEAQTP